MPVVKTAKGYKIKRSKGGTYPKVYKSLASAKKRVAQMEMFKNLRKRKSA
jgi:hypothetical protein